MTYGFMERRPNPRRTIMFTDGAFVGKNVHGDVNGRPLIVIEQSDGVTVRLNWSFLMGYNDPILDVVLSPEGCMADVTYEGATAMLHVWGARECGQITVQARFQSGETHTSVIAVRLPERFTERRNNPAGVNQRGIP